MLETEVTQTMDESLLFRVSSIATKSMDAFLTVMGHGIHIRLWESDDNDRLYKMCLGTYINTDKCLQLSL